MPNITIIVPLGWRVVVDDSGDTVKIYTIQGDGDVCRSCGDGECSAGHDGEFNRPSVAEADLIDR